MTQIAFQNGSPILREGSIGVEQSCCCTPDNERIVKCCYQGVCAEVTAAECTFLGGEEVSDCNECTEEEGLDANDCSECCTEQEIDAVVTAFVNDPFCLGISGVACFATRTYGRLGEPLRIQASVTLEKNVGLFGSDCDYGFSGCGSFTDFGDVTYLQVWVRFITDDNGKCALRLSQFIASVQTCFALDNANLSACTQPASGGACSETIGDGSAVGSSVPSVCIGAVHGTNALTYTWASFGLGCWTTISGQRVTGTPLTRDSGNVTCSTISSLPTGEASHTVESRVSVRLV